MTCRESGSDSQEQRISDHFDVEPVVVGQPGEVGELAAAAAARGPHASKPKDEWREQDGGDNEQGGQGATPGAPLAA